MVCCWLFDLFVVRLFVGGNLLIGVWLLLNWLCACVCVIVVIVVCCLLVWFEVVGWLVCWLVIRVCWLIIGSFGLWIIFGFVLCLWFMWVSFVSFVVVGYFFALRFGLVVWILRVIRFSCSCVTCWLTCKLLIVCVLMI